VAAAVLDLGDAEGAEQARRIADPLDLEPDPEQPLDDLVEVRISIEILLQPLEREFHDRPPGSVGT
jgi:hypothetical protein